MHDLANSIVTGMPYPPTIVELISLNRFLPKGFDNGIIQEFSTGDYMHFTFCRFSQKIKFFGNFDRYFRKCLTKGFFFT